VTLFRLIVGRVFIALVTLLLVSVVVFAMVEVLPGDAATHYLGRYATEDTLAALRQQMNLHLPPVQRYFIWIGNLAQGDLGTTLSSRRAIGLVIGEPIKNSIILGTAALALYFPLTLTIALTQALRRDEPVDHTLSIVTLVLLSIPDFILATILMIAFVATIPIFPAVSIVGPLTSLDGWMRALALPAVTLALVMTVYAVRMLRDNVIEVLDSDYVRMAELKGLSRLRVLTHHALPNALIPTLNITALNMAYLIGGVVIVEVVFSYPGFGSLLVQALQLRDSPLIEATVLIASATYIGANLVADALTIVLNPRVKGR